MGRLGTLKARMIISMVLMFIAIFGFLLVMTTTIYLLYNNYNNQNTLASVINLFQINIRSYDPMSFGYFTKLFIISIAISMNWNGFILGINMLFGMSTSSILVIYSILVFSNAPTSFIIDVLNSLFIISYFFSWTNILFGDISGFFGSLLALAGITGLFIIFQWAIGPYMVRRKMDLHYLRNGENPWLESVVKKIAEKSKLMMPKIVILKDEEPNSFVFGDSEETANLVVTKGLLDKLNQNEIKAVIAHEIGHIKHKDYIVMTSLAAMPIFCLLIVKFIFSGFILSRYVVEPFKKSEILIRQIMVLPLILIIWPIIVIAMVAYIVGLLIVRTLSRMREFYADAYSAYITENPRAMKSALTRIAYGLSVTPKETQGVRAFFIEDPVRARNEIQKIEEHGSEYDLDKDGIIDEKELELAMEAEAKKSIWHQFISLFSMHPSTYKRILLLSQIEKEMSSGRYETKNIYRYV